MIRKSGKETADEKMENISRKKNNLLLSFVEAVKEEIVEISDSVAEQIAEEAVAKPKRRYYKRKKKQ